MYRYLRVIIPLSLILLSSCFSGRKIPQEAKIPIVDPVVISLDTSLLARPAADLETDSVPANGTALKLIDIEVDTIPALADSAANIPLDFYLSDEISVNDSLIEAARPDTICIIGTGDIMPGTNYPDNRYLPPGNDCNALFRPVADILRSGDVTFGNLEGVFCPEGGKAKECKDPSVCYVFRMPDSYLECILDAGYDVLGVANNHINDFGVEGRVYTAKKLSESGIPFAGFQTVPSAIFEANGIRYGFAAFAPHTGTLNLKDYSGAASIIAGLDSICDIVIVSFHGGAEGKDYQHVPCTDEEYLGYNRGNVCKFAHTAVDAGADIIFGHGPHVIRAMELYKGRLICYSLGNFCTYARFNLSGPNGIAPIVKAYTSREGVFISGEIIPIYQAGEGGPRLDPQSRAIIKLQDLSNSDFPESKLFINEKGVISIKE